MKSCDAVLRDENRKTIALWCHDCSRHLAPSAFAPSAEGHGNFYCRVHDGLRRAMKKLQKRLGASTVGGVLTYQRDFPCRPPPKDKVALAASAAMERAAARLLTKGSIAANSVPAPPSCVKGGSKAPPAGLVTKGACCKRVRVEDEGLTARDSRAGDEALARRGRPEQVPDGSLPGEDVPKPAGGVAVAATLAGAGPLDPEEDIFASSGAAEEAGGCAGAKRARGDGGVAPALGVLALDLEEERISRAFAGRWTG